MITFFDLIKDAEFRNFVSDRLATITDNTQYSFPDTFPLLYKYNRLSECVVDNIIDNRISATRIGEFNDLFDGAMHQYGTLEDREYTAESRWNTMEQLRISANLPEGILKRDYFIETYKKHLKATSRLKFRALDNLKTYVCCLSTQNNSTLMWSHYGASNTGICIEYDFNMLAMDFWMRNAIFPVAYSNNPVDLHDLLNDQNGKVFKYSLDAAILCAALNKASVWKYEKEWRIVSVFALSEIKKRWVPFKAPDPTRIIFGYHFLKSFFYYDNGDESERKKANESLKNIKKLLTHLEKKQIPIAIMAPAIGKYKLIPKTISIQTLLDLICENFDDDNEEDMRFYYTIHDRLMDVIECENNI